MNIRLNNLKRIVFDSKKSRDKLIGKQIRCINADEITKQLIKDEIYTIKYISAGNYEAFVYLEEFLQERYSEYSRKIVPNSFKVTLFELVE